MTIFQNSSLVFAVCILLSGTLCRNTEVLLGRFDQNIHPEHDANRKDRYIGANGVVCPK